MRELDYTKMGLRIRQVRRAKGWSQDELAKKCGISMSFLGHIERGTRIMSLETFSGICSALGAGADEILWGVAHPSDSLHDIWRQSDQKPEGNAGRKTDERQKEKNAESADSYAMYVRIMKSVAEIMNEA